MSPPEVEGFDAGFADSSGFTGADAAGFTGAAGFVTAATGIGLAGCTEGADADADAGADAEADATGDAL